MVNENALKYRASVIKIFVDLAYGFEVEDMDLETILELMEFLCLNGKCKESDFERMILCLCCHLSNSLLKTMSYSRKWQQNNNNNNNGYSKLSYVSG